MPRDIFLVVLRHGEKAADGNLTEVGRGQARAAGQQIASGTALGSNVKVYTSKSGRAIETGAEIQKALNESGFGPRVPRTRKEFMGKIPDMGAFTSAVKKFGGEDKAVEAWLRGTFDKKAIEPVSAAHERIKTLLEFPKWLSQWLGEGKPLKLVYVSHSWTIAAMVELFFRRKMQAMSGPIKLCEPVTFKFASDGVVSVMFRNKKKRINLKQAFPLPQRLPRKQAKKRAVQKRRERRRI